MSIELILLSVNINLVAFSSYLGDLVGQVFAMFVLTVAAGEAAIGLAILVAYFRNRGTIAVEDINMMKGCPPNDPGTRLLAACRGAHRRAGQLCVRPCSGQAADHGRAGHRPRAGQEHLPSEDAGADTEEKSRGG